jgi:hypothetical protein
MTDRSLAVVESPGAVASAAEIRANVNLIQEVMRAVMQDGTHYGKIPGTQKPTLFKAGSEKILSTFRIAIEPFAEDLSTPDCARYRVTCRATSQVSGAFLGAGIGECSSSEEKYSYRGIVHEKEWLATPEDRRRVKFTRDGGEIKQVRTNPADVANTVLKMAKKRAQIDATLTATAASDIFTQDIEDLPEELQRAVAEEGATPAKPDLKPPQRKSEPAPTAQGDATAGVTITAVEERSGQTNGKPWALYLIKLSDGREGATFDTKIRDAAVALRASRAAVEAVIEGANGKRKIVELSPAVA